MSDHRPYNVLFLCTGNSARSILAEAFLNAEGKGRFRAFSAGSFPKGTVNPHAIALLEHLGLPTADLRSKSWDEFAVSGAPQMDFVFTVCDQAAGEVCPVWPGQPVTAHWGIPDPAAVDGSEAEKMQAFREALRMLSNRIRVFTELPFGKLDRIRLKAHLDDIGRTDG
ncbi:MAG: arsenate reductase ArsC [Alphaproteobacteria bacterium]|nr:arsenate reductase ArsC [Alphaproteobacteria bacterium]MDE1987139.1 arsenate reductase ArsC [Alphaproteobacteria bacterium]MDE2162907.1 arsenate reductase ArsC [Alphaproteobacteria bacterium]MDE2266443.1 arsenate reductase ArsC [Alphaproteobacteria bacterium]MDE2499416.1 arsenate reductase ArsC [Alphaproteobacteria bacterium]